MFRYALHMELQPSSLAIDYREPLVFMGSCFSEHIASRLTDLGFKIGKPANGVVFNPLSLAHPFQRILLNQDYSEADLVFYNGLWHGKFHHGVFSELNQADVLLRMNAALRALKISLESSKTIFVTFGSAYVYQWNESVEIFANCHKIPQSKFSKRLLSVVEIVDAWQKLITGFQRIYPHIQFVFTVSPVKHLRDGVVENNLSKSTLFLAIHQLQKANSNLHYFPAYELVNDDLRDYRFYESDGAHPNAMAVDYVFDQFVKSMLNVPSQAYIQDLLKYQVMSRHKLIHADAEEGLKFLKKLDAFRDELELKYQIVL